MGNKVKVVKETNTGKNIKFQDTSTGRTMTTNQFVSGIEKGKYPDYHVRNIKGEKIPASNPDKKKNNNLG